MFKDKRVLRAYHREYIRRWRASAAEGGGLSRGGDRNVKPYGKGNVKPFVPTGEGNVKPYGDKSVKPFEVSGITRQKVFKDTVLPTREAGERAWDCLSSGITPWTRIVYLDGDNVVEPGTGEILGMIQTVEGEALERIEALERRGRLDAEHIAALSFRLASMEIESVSHPQGEEERMERL